jgi:plasmid stability protein
MEESDQVRLNEVEVRKILSEIVETIERTPNNMELGNSLRKKYWKELKEIKENI